MTDKRYISTGDAAKLKGCSLQTVRNHIKSGKLDGAMSGVIGRKGEPQIDSDSDCFRDWLGVPRVEVKKPQEPPQERVRLADLDQRSREDLQARIIELTDDYGQWDEVYNWAKVRKEMAQANTAEIRRDEVLGLLIRREFVEKYVIGMIDGMTRRLLTDVAHTTARRVAEGAKAGRTQSELKALVSDLIGATIEQVKHEVVEALERGRPAESGDE